MLVRKQITFDTFVRSVMACIIVVALLMLLNRLSSVLTPFFVAWLLAYLIFPLVSFFQYRCRMKYRIVAIAAAFAVVGTVLWLVAMLIVPPMIEEAQRAKELLVAYIENDVVMSTIPQRLQEFVRTRLNADLIKSIVTHDSFIDGVKEAVPRIWNVVAQSISMVSGLFSLTMIFLYTLFILIDYEQISSGWLGLLPERFRGFASQLVGDVEQSMNKYFRGQAIVAFCVGVLFSIGFVIIGFPMAVGLGMFIGLLNMVPYLQIVGFIPTILLAIVHSADTGENFWFILGMALLVFAVVQTIQDTLLTPRIMGKVTGLNSAIILLSLSIWGSLLGILGMVIALPMTTLLLAYYQKYVIRTEKYKPTSTNEDTHPERSQPESAGQA